jgi:triphosphoribosyl-dephospho-CoA synthetase
MSAKVSRTTIQNALNSAISAACAQVEKDLGLSTSDPDAQRRLFRAVVTLAARRILDVGLNPQVVMGQAFEAVMTEVKARGAQAVAQGNPFGLKPPAAA